MATIPVRIPLTLAAALAFHVSMSPPTGPTSHPDMPGDRRAIRATARFITTMLTKGLYWASAFTDTLVLLAPHVPISLPTPLSLPTTGTRLLSSIRPTTLGLGLSLSLSLPSSLALHLHLHPPLPLATTIAGTTLALTGALLRLAAYHALGPCYACPHPPTPPGTSESHRGGARNHPVHNPGHAHALVTTGPYAFVRHPGYAGLALCTTGLVVLHLDALKVYLSSSGVSSWGLEGTGVRMRTVTLACAVLATVGAVRRIRNEERALKACFEGEWEAWTRRVRYRLVPGVY